MNQRFVLADLPGYGYARISKDRRAEWRPLIEGYLRRSPNLRGVVQLIDVRREPSEDDLQMLEFLSDLGAPTVVAITKVDKLSPAAATARVRELTEALGLDADQVIPFSAYTGLGRDDLASAIVALAEQPSSAPRNDAVTICTRPSAGACLLEHSRGPWPARARVRPRRHRQWPGERAGCRHYVADAARALPTRCPGFRRQGSARFVRMTSRSA